MKGSIANLRTEMINTGHRGKKRRGNGESSVLDFEGGSEGILTAQRGQEFGTAGRFVHVV